MGVKKIEGVEWIEDWWLWRCGEYFIVPREDEDGIDFFYAKGRVVDSEFEGTTFTRYVSGEDYWVPFQRMSPEDREAFLKMVQIIKSRDWGDEFAEKSKWRLPDYIYDG